MLTSNSATTLSKVTKIHLVKDHTCNGKEPFCVESTCATLVVGQFVVWPISVSHCSWVF